MERWERGQAEGLGAGGPAAGERQEAAGVREPGEGTG